MPISAETIINDTPEYTDVRFTETDALGNVVTVTTDRRFKAGTAQANKKGLNTNLDAQFAALSGTWDANWNTASNAQKLDALRAQVETQRRTIRNLIRDAREDVSSTGDA